MQKSLGTPEHAALAALLKSLRIDAGLTQADLASLLDEPQSFISKYEAGERRLDIVELAAIATHLGIGLISLLKRLGYAE